MNSLFSYHNSLIIIFIAILFSTEKINTSSASTTQNPETPFECRFKRMGGTLPESVCYIREFLKKVNEMTKNGESTAKLGEEGFQNFYIFYGKKGAGKTTTATLLKDEADVELILIRGCDLHDLILKSISPNAALKEVIAHAKEYSKKNHKPVIILIDEMDGVWKDCDEEKKELIFGALRANLDQNRNNPNLFIIFTSNDIKKKDEAFIDRCRSIEWEQPNEKNRREILEFYAKVKGIKLSEKFYQNAIKKTADFNGRNFYFVFDVANERAKIRLSKIREEDLWVGIEHEIKIIQATKSTWFEWTKSKATEYKTATTILVTGAAGATLAVTEVVVKKLTGISIIETIQNLSNKQGSK